MGTHTTTNSTSAIDAEQVIDTEQVTDVPAAPRRFRRWCEE